ncbi:MAG TPA: tetratricopeptide repeat protein [Streptosporangiaceae bacterium]|nr:tetratricopeptide repeat protein [Streptosporangiaceae bacterium]
MKFLAAGARQITLDVLPDGEARELLTRRVGTKRARAEPGAVEELTQLCGRLPLALVVVAARAAARSAMPLAAAAAELTGTAARLGALQTGDPLTDVRTVFSWSYQHLGQEPARLFRLLGVCPGPDITASATAALLGIGQDGARAALDALAMANLAAEHVPGRFVLHDLLRAYAAEQADEREPPTERTAAIQRALDYYLHTSHAAALLLDPAREPVTLDPPQHGVIPEPLTSSQQALAWFEAEHRVLISAVRAADQTGSDTYAWQLPWAMEDFLNWRGHWQEWAATQRTAVAAATRLGDVAGQATARRLLAHSFARIGDYVQASGLLTHCLGLYRQLGDQVGEGRVHQTLGWVAERQNRYADALSHAEQALALYKTAGDQARQAAALNNVGWFSSWPVTITGHEPSAGEPSLCTANSATAAARQAAGTASATPSTSSATSPKPSTATATPSTSSATSVPASTKPSSSPTSATSATPPETREEPGLPGSRP